MKNSIRTPYFRFHLCLDTFSPVYRKQKSKPIGLDFFICVRVRFANSWTLTSFAWHTQHHLSFSSISLPLRAAQMNEVEAMPQMMYFAMMLRLRRKRCYFRQMEASTLVPKRTVGDACPYKGSLMFSRDML